MKWSYFGNRLIITHIAWAWDYIGWFLYMAYSQWEAGVVDEEAEAERMRLRRQEERKRKRRARGLTCVEDDYYDDSDDAEPAKETVLVHDVFTDKDGKLLDVSKIDLKHHAGKKGKDTDLWQWRTETRTKRRRLPKTSMRDLHLHAYTHLMRFLYPKEIMAIRQVNRLCRYVALRLSPSCSHARLHTHWDTDAFKSFAYMYTYTYTRYLHAHRTGS